MVNLLFVSSWAQDRKRTWSGTTYGLYVSLMRRCAIIDCDITAAKTDKLLWKLVGLFKKPTWTQKAIMYYRKILHRRYGKHLNGQKRIVFQFAEIVQETPSCRTFIYIDNSVSYLSFVKKNLPDLFPYLKVAETESQEMAERFESQMQYFRSCSGIFTMGHWLMKDLIDRCGISGDKVHCVGGGINLCAEPNRSIAREGNKILFIGRDFKRKGGYITYDAFVRLKHEIPNLQLYVAGPKVNPIVDSIEGYHFMGDCDKAKLQELYNKCDLFCMPSYFEAYGLSFGLPCIGRNCYEMPYFIEEGVTGELITDDDINVLASKIQKILEDDSYAKNVAQKRDWYLEEYSWDMVAKRILNVIKSA